MHRLALMIIVLLLLSVGGVQAKEQCGPLNPCKPGERANRNRITPVCPGGKTWSGSRCVSNCPLGTQWQGGRCAPLTPKTRNLEK